VVKVIWHQTASPPQTDGSIAFARWRQCALPCRHIGATWQIRLNLCFLRPTAHPSAQPKRQIDRLSCFAHLTVESPYTLHTLQWATLSPKIVHSHGGFGRPSNTGPSEPISQTASRSVQPFLHRWPQSVLILYNGTPLFPSKLPLLIGDLDPYLIRGSLGPP